MARQWGGWVWHMDSGPPLSSFSRRTLKQETGVCFIWHPEYLNRNIEIANVSRWVKLRGSLVQAKYHIPWIRFDVSFKSVEYLKQLYGHCYCQTQFCQVFALADVCAAYLRICVFVCPLIPNLNICPTSPNNIGPVARPCPLETAINSMLFLPILVLVHWPMTNKRKSKVGWDCENMEGEGLLIPDKSAQHPLPSMGSWEPKMLKYRCSKLILNMGGKYDMYGIHSGISL